jgi:hypothetical protein
MTTQDLLGFDAGELEAWFAFDTPDDHEDPFECRSPGPGPGAVYEEAYDLACIARYERHVAAVQGEQTLAIAGFVADYVRDHQVRFPTAALDEARRSAYAEIALALGIADRTSDNRVAVACELVERLPATVTAMRLGQVTLPKARVVLEETVHLDPVQRAVVEEIMLPKAPGLTPGNLRRSTRRLVEKLDAEALVKRKQAAKADRWVRWWEQPDGMATLEARLTAADAAAVFGVIDGLAHAAQSPQALRTIDQICADAFVDIILRPLDAPDRVRYTINLTVPADLLLAATGNDTTAATATAAAFTGAGLDPDRSGRSPPTRPGAASSPTRPPVRCWTRTHAGTDPARRRPSTSAPATSTAAGPAVANQPTGRTSTTRSPPRTADPPPAPTPPCCAESTTGSSTSPAGNANRPTTVS